jgi:hypothetical protein
MSAIENAGATIGTPNGGVVALLLAGSLRTARSQPIARALGVPVAALPVDAQHSLLSWWFRLFREVPQVSRIAIALSDPSVRPLYERIALESGCEISIWVDRNEHRGTGGTVRDFFDDMRPALADGLLVAECSMFGHFPLSRLFEDRPNRAPATVLVGAGGQPAGVMHLSREAIELIPAVGYLDLKEQLIPAISRNGGRTAAVVVDGRPQRLGDLADYLRVLAMRAQAGAELISPRASVDGNAILQGTVLVGRAAIVSAAAVLSDAIVMQAARIGEGAIVARSVIPPGAVVPAGARVVDQIYAPLETAGRDVR